MDDTILEAHINRAVTCMEDIWDEIENISQDERMRNLSFKDQCALAVLKGAFSISTASKGRQACREYANIVAKMAYDAADAMDEERKKRNKQ